MRLLIYLLALVSGFSAAEAARAEVSPASSVAQSAVAAAEALASQDESDAVRPDCESPRENAVPVLRKSPVALAHNSPIIRHDLSHE